MAVKMLAVVRLMPHRMRPLAVGILAVLGLLGALGSRVARADDPVSSSVRYNREIVRIFERKCIACHTDGTLAMPLDSYHDVRPWAQAIREEILERRMPPWPAAPGVRPLANELALSTREIAIITAWIDGGTPRGEPSDLPAPGAQAAWKAGKPDLTFALPPQKVTADGSAYVRRVKVETDLPRDRWLRGFDIAPGERRALRSVFLYLKSGGGTEQWLGGWTPWFAMTEPPGNVAFRVPAGASLEAELHYAGWNEDDRPMTDASTLGLYFQRDRPASVVETITVTAATAARALRGEMILNNDVVIWAVKPRFAAGASDVKSSAVKSDGPADQHVAMEMRAVTPGGGIEPLLWIKDHRDDWQLPYVLREPLRLPRGSRLVFTAHGTNISGASATASVLTYRADAVADPTGRAVGNGRP